MKKILFSFVVFISLSLLFSSCKKSNDDRDCEITEANIAGIYKLSAAVRIQGSVETDVLHVLYNDCELDDTNELKTNNTFVYTDAGVVCSPSGSETGTWSISGNTLILNGVSLTTIVSYDCSKMVVTYPDGSSTIRETYTRQ